jgi:hypothetical protein
MEIFNKMSDQDSHKVLDRLIGRLNKNIVKWPNNPVFYNYVGTIYSMLDVPEMAIEASQKTIDKFPDYLMGKIAHGYNLINNDRTDEVAALFNHEFSLNQVCPDREEFHISEYVAFHTLMSYYFVKKEDIITARTYRNMVEDIDIPENVPVNEEILELVDIEVEECVHTLLVDTGKDKKARAELIALLVN